MDTSALTNVEVVTPPAFVSGGHIDELQVTVGETFELSAFAKNIGGAAKGIGLFVIGSAIDRGLVTLDKATLTTASSVTERHIFEYAWQGQAADRQQVYYALFDEAEINSTDLNPTDDEPDKQKAIEAVIITSVHASIEGKGLAEGVGTLTLTFIPMTNEAGHLALTTDLTVQSKS